MAELFKVNAPVRKPLYEGVQGENEARSIQFDITPWVEELGDGAVTATAKRSQDSQPYPVTVTKDGTTVTWKPTSTDTAFAGVGSFQLEYTVDSVLAKTCIWSTMVAPSLDPAGDPPDPYDNWLAEMRQIAADALQDAQDADASADAAASSAEESAGAAQEVFDPVVEKMVLKESDNLSKSDSDWTSGYYMAPNGSAGASSGMAYSAKIPVSEGDVVRCYANRGGTFSLQNLRFVCAYDASDTAQSSKGSNADSPTYTVPSGITHVIVTVRELSNYDYCVLLNKTTTEFIPYFDPYYVAEYNFIDEAMKEYEPPAVTPKGYNLLKNCESGVGAYYASGNTISYMADSTFRYFIMDVKKNTVYYFTFGTPRFYILVDENGNVVGSGNGGVYTTYLETGDAVKLYFTQYASDVSAGVVGVIEGYCGTLDGLQKPSFVSDVSLLLQNNKYACAMPRKELLFTQGIEETIYLKNMFSLNPDLLNAYLLVPEGARTEKGFNYTNVHTNNSVNGYRFKVYDSAMAKVDSVDLCPFKVIAKNLSSCSALVLGDSQIEQGRITQNMLDTFTADGKTLTLLGTRGTAPNLTEGRSGWSAGDYCTVASKAGVPNLFWNASTEEFDFSYYMSNQGYSSVDFVIINLAGNDLYNAGIEDEQMITNTVGYIFEIIESILTFNASQKIILNLAPATTWDPTKAINTAWVVRNIYVRYNNIMQVLRYKYPNNIHTSYTHLVVDPETDLADHIHENANGYKKMADELINQINQWQNQ